MAAAGFGRFAAVPAFFDHFQLETAFFTNVDFTFFHGMTIGHE